jgi:hypothetical protein
MSRAFPATKHRELFLRKNNQAITAAFPVRRKQLNCKVLSIFQYQILVYRVIHVGKEVENNKKHWCSCAPNCGITYTDYCVALLGFYTL